MTHSSVPVFADILDAAARIAPWASVTPLLHARQLDAMAGARLFFKAEQLQRGGAFKFRGACNAVWSLTDAQAAAGVLTHSSGNHGAALALAARTRDIGSHVVVPEGAVASKLGNIVRNGATLWRCAPTLQAREETCARIQRETGATLVHPYADARVIAGQGTAVLELVRQMEAPPDVLVVPVGGGGLAAGAALALTGSAPDCELMLAEPAGADDAARLLTGRALPEPFLPQTLCDGLRGTLGAPNLAILQGRARVRRVDDADTVAAMKLLWQVLKQVVEPSSAIALAAVLAEPERYAGRRVGIVLSGGNVDLDALPWGSA